MFAQRIKQLRKQKNLTQAEFATIFNIATGTIGMWESGKREPNHDTIRKIADYFDVSADYLLGRTDNPAPISEVFAVYAKEGYGGLPPEALEELNTIKEYIINKYKKP